MVEYMGEIRGYPDLCQFFKREFGATYRINGANAYLRVPGSRLEGARLCLLEFFKARFGRVFIEDARELGELITDRYGQGVYLMEVKA